eukprot:2227102-Rhodomonas_salina.1
MELALAAPARARVQILQQPHASSFLCLAGKCPWLCLFVGVCVCVLPGRLAVARLFRPRHAESPQHAAAAHRADLPQGEEGPAGNGVLQGAAARAPARREPLAAHDQARGPAPAPELQLFHAQRRVQVPAALRGHAAPAPGRALGAVQGALRELWPELRARPPLGLPRGAGPSLRVQDRAAPRHGEPDQQEPHR